MRFMVKISKQKKYTFCKQSSTCSSNSDFKKKIDLLESMVSNMRSYSSSDDCQGSRANILLSHKGS